jgi:sulfofructose kinase
MTLCGIVGLGVAVIDILQLMDRFPARGEIRRAVAMSIQGGEPLATAMVTLARLGVQVAVLDVIGDDWRGVLIREEFQREGVCTDHIRPLKGCTSSFSCVLVTAGDGSRTIVYSPSFGFTFSNHNTAFPSRMSSCRAPGAWTRSENQSGQSCRHC